MPYVNDFSDAFEISLPAPTVRTASDSLVVSESLSRSIQTWKVVESHSDSVSTAESLATPSVTTYRTTVSTSDSLSLSESLARSLDTWEHIHSHSDTISTAESLAKSTYAYRTTVTTSDSVSSSESLARSLDTWRYILSNSDSISTAESLAKSIYTYRTPVSASDSVNTSESLNRAVETWRYILSHSMGISLSESLNRAIITYRTAESNSDSIGTSESLALLVETWQYIFSPSDSVTVSESLSKAVQAWFYTATPSDSLAVSDSLSVQITIDNDTYFYDTGGLSSKSRLTGSISSGLFTSDTTRVSNSDNLVDSNTNSPCTFSGSNSEACIVFDMTAQTDVNYMALYGSGGTIYFYGSNSQGSGYSLIGTGTIGINKWAIAIFSSQNYRYYAIQMEGLSADATLGEVLFGLSFSPEIRYDLGSSTGTDSLLVSNESYNGTEYTNQIGDVVNLYDRQYGNISPTLKTDFENLWIKSNDKKFLYYFDGINYVSVSPIRMNEIAHNRYSTSVSLRT